MSEKTRILQDTKLKAFSVGSMGKRTLSKKEAEELRKKEEEKAAAHAFQEFVQTFQDVPLNGNKVWIKAGTYDAGARREDTKEKGKLYKPQSKVSQPPPAAIPSEVLSSAERAQAYARMLTGDKKPDRLGKRKLSSKSNLESFKEELRQIQEERVERHRYKGSTNRASPIESEVEVLKPDDLGSFDNGDPTTTNLYLGNLNPKITEQQLMQVFGRYGPLASIKIMWPRSDEEKARGRNCGFVAYMSRKDGERALKHLNGRDVLGYEMKLGWGKSVIIPPHPIYIPPALMELSMPPPPSGLPFNAQPALKDKDVLPTTAEELNQILRSSVVKVVMPTDRNLLMLIHRMVEFVVREGPLFEAIVMNREIVNPMFRFLFENQSPAHIYYRWKLYSILHGDSQKEWRTTEFRMFKEGSTWKPPLMASYTSGMPDELVLEDEAREASKGSLSITQRDRLEELIRNLTPERRSIGEAMIFCIEHSEASDEIAECILESLSNSTTPITKKIARFYLISDILHNCSIKVNRASFYRKAFENRLLEIMRQLRCSYEQLKGRLKADGFKVRVLRTVKAWEDAFYSKEFMIKVHNAFLGFEYALEKQRWIDEHMQEYDLDGNPLAEVEAEEDDAPMDGAALLKSALKQNWRSPSPVDDIDGVEIDDGDENSADILESGKLSGFIRSKWETIDPGQIEAQAMTTSKWDLLEEESEENSPTSRTENQDSSDCTDLRDLSEEKRTKLREIEVKAVQYQDELESGQRTLKTGWTVPQQVEHYRRKLLKKSDKVRKTHKDSGSSKSEKHKRDSSDEEYYTEATSRKNKKHARSSTTLSTSKNRSKSRTPVRKRSRATSPATPSPRRPAKLRYRSPTSPDSSSHSSSKQGRSTPTPPRRRRASTSVSPPIKSRHKDPSPDVPRKRKHKHRH